MQRATASLDIKWQGREELFHILRFHPSCLLLSSRVTSPLTTATSSLASASPHSGQRGDVSRCRRYRHFGHRGSSISIVNRSLHTRQRDLPCATVCSVRHR